MVYKVRVKHGNLVSEKERTFSGFLDVSTDTIVERVKKVLSKRQLIRGDMMEALVVISETPEREIALLKEFIQNDLDPICSECSRKHGAPVGGWLRWLVADTLKREESGGK